MTFRRAGFLTSLNDDIFEDTVLVMGSDSPFCCHREVLIMPPWSNKNCSVLTKQGLILCKTTWGFLRVWLAGCSTKIPSAEAAAKLSVALCGLAHIPRVSFPGRGEAAVVSLLLSQLYQKKSLKATQGPEQIQSVYN